MYPKEFSVDPITSLLQPRHTNEANAFSQSNLRRINAHVYRRIPRAPDKIRHAGCLFSYVRARLSVEAASTDYRENFQRHSITSRKNRVARLKRISPCKTNASRCATAQRKDWKRKTRGRGGRKEKRKQRHSHGCGYHRTSPIALN